MKCVFTSRTDSVLNLSPLYTLYVFSASVPEAENIVYEALENERPIRAFAEDLCFNLCHKNNGKGDRHFSAHGGSVCLKVVASIELE